MLQKLQQLMIGLTIRGGAAEQQRDLRAMSLSLAKLLRKDSAARKANPLHASETFAKLEALDGMAGEYDREAATWLDAKAIADGQSGPFHACDLPCWLAIAEHAGVAAVPAREILRLEPEEASLASGVIEIGAIPIAQKLRTAWQAEMKAEGLSLEAPYHPPVDPEALVEKMFSAMDDVPEGWMVRTAICGGSNLKALAGTGLAGETAPEVKFGSQLEVGPGWVRVGNRRRVDMDSRTTKLYAEAPTGPLVFLARPWVKSSRYLVADDPHRHGSPFQGPGRWPAEWRAFVVKGKVTGVSMYYGWAGEATPFNAKMALEVRDLAQKMVDEAKRRALWPRLMDIEFARHNPKFAEVLADYGREDVACTLDFIETENGILFLEGGPAASPVGGGHFCAFAGCGGPPKIGMKPDLQGVAFKPMPHVLIAEPKTWIDGDRTGCILEWDEVERIAASE